MSKLRDKQLELLKEAVKLAEENPGLEIHICAASNELLPEFAWTDHQITRVVLDWQFQMNSGEIVVGLDRIQDELEIERDEEVTEEQAQAVSVQVILIYTAA